MEYKKCFFLSVMEYNNDNNVQQWFLRLAPLYIIITTTWVENAFKKNLDEFKSNIEQKDF